MTPSEANVLAPAAKEAMVVPPLTSKLPPTMVAPLDAATVKVAGLGAEPTLRSPRDEWGEVRDLSGQWRMDNDRVECMHSRLTLEV